MTICEPTPNPGCPEARALGCICDPVANHEGHGCPWRRGVVAFFVHVECCVHGEGCHGT